MSTSNRNSQGLDRIVAAGVGTLFLALAGAIVVSAPLTLGVVLAAFALGSLGLEAIISAVRGRRCLLSKIGPLP